MAPESDLVYLQRIARLQSLLEATRRVHASIRLDEVLDQVLRTAVKELEIAGAALVPQDGAAAVPPWAYGQVPEVVRVDAPPPGAALYPVHAKDGTPMATLVALPREGQALVADEVDFLEGLALQASVAVENARYHEESLRWQRLQQDLDTARAIQRSLIPQTMPEIPGYLVAGRSEACYEVGGDYLDILACPGGDTLFLVADVAGKGLSSALIGSAFRAALKGLVASSVPLPDLVRRLNDLHLEESEEARRKYVTAILARLTPGEHRLEVVNAGHTPGLLVSPGGATRQLKSSGPPIGLIPEMEYPSETVAFEPGASLLLYSDGLSEASRGEDDFGRERLAERVAAGADGPPDHLLDDIWRAVAAFEDGQGPCDDKTALLVRRP